MNSVYWIFIVVLAVVVCACDSHQPRFELLSISRTGIDFNNKLTESDTLNILLFEYMYNGAGVGAGDFNNDGLTDLFFAGNMVPGKMYLNQGDFDFEDITAAANVETKEWCTGVSLVDINQDSLLDIYLCTIHPDRDKSSPNLLYLNKGLNADGTPVFEEVAEKVGLADKSYSTQAAFLDYDLDGDLDMYLLTNSLESYPRNSAIGQRVDGTGKSVDKFFRNEGINASGLPSFTDVSKEAGILAEGWGLGVIINDINRDGYPDIYAANDFLSNDHLYINNRNGTFTNKIAHYLKHQEYNGMGVDIADINNDGLNDIVAVDMMPEDNLRQKTMFSGIGYDKFMRNLQMNYQPQYVRNVLQLNNGNNTFSDIGYLAGIYATDWSWSSLFADFDNDGFQDLLITNGYRKDITDLDFVAYSKESSMFGTDQTRLKNAVKAIEEAPGVKKPNFIFRNNGDLTFTDESAAWGLTESSYSNGAVYADLDNDGDLDIVTNNINDPAFIFQNTSVEREGEKNHFLRIRLKGNKGNSQGLGAKLEVRCEGKQYFREHQLHRGYLSTVEDFFHVGLGSAAKADTIRITWPSGKSQLLTQVAIDRIITLEEKNAAVNNQPPVTVEEESLFVERSGEMNILFKHEEADYIDFKSTATLPHKHSQAGPGIAVGDLNNDGLEDFIVGGSANRPATLFYQKKDGTFSAGSFLKKEEEDMGMLLLDADGDGDEDLYCASGSTEFRNDNTKYQHRFYRNNGKGKFEKDSPALPAMQSSGSCVVACDYDHDGDLDIFAGGRIVPLRYPEPARSFLLNNDGSGHFNDVTAAVCADLVKPGLVTAALWTDYDNDGWVDLLLVGEWMPITFFKNQHGKTFDKQHIPSLSSSFGWWNSIAGGDVDNDGDIDYIAGNLGRNSIFQSSEKEPVCIYAKDYDKNGSLDPILCRYIQGKEYPVHGRETMTDLISPLRRKLTRYEIYGKSTIHSIFPEEELKEALLCKSTLFSTVYIENKGNGTFDITALPVEAQFTPAFGIAVNDINSDGNLDVLLVGNSYAEETLNGYYDAGIGTALLGDGAGGFKSMSVKNSAFLVRGDAKGLAELTGRNGETMFIVTQNRDSLRTFTLNQHKIVKSIPTGTTDSYAEIVLQSGKRRKHEIYYGSGYLSSSSRNIPANQKFSSVKVFSTKNGLRTITLK